MALLESWLAPIVVASALAIRAKLAEMIYSLRLENLKVRAMLDIKRDRCTLLVVNSPSENHRDVCIRFINGEELMNVTEVYCREFEIQKIDNRVNLQSLQDAVRIANNLMDQKLKGYAVRNTCETGNNGEKNMKVLALCNTVYASYVRALALKDVGSAQGITGVICPRLRPTTWTKARRSAAQAGMSICMRRKTSHPYALDVSSAIERDGGLQNTNPVFMGPEVYGGKASTISGQGYGEGKQDQRRAVIEELRRPGLSKVFPKILGLPPHDTSNSKLTSPGAAPVGAPYGVRRREMRTVTNTEFRKGIFRRLTMRIDTTSGIDDLFCLLQGLAVTNDDLSKDSQDYQVYDKDSAQCCAQKEKVIVMLSAAKNQLRRTNEPDWNWRVGVRFKDVEASFYGTKGRIPGDRETNAEEVPSSVRYHVSASQATSYVLRTKPFYGERMSHRKSVASDPARWLSVGFDLDSMWSLCDM
ncbi:hypothetical protein Tco_1032921 [Tanacetum coccineum]|uniref:Uncharacterized protein n=1 Tax=Tanacetum coccineum TaxID=301880 RepID=A0ABQ5GEK6_9ASTR